VRLTRIAVAGLLLGVGLFGLPDVSKIKLPATSVVEEVKIAEPSDKMKKLVEPIAKIVETMTELDRLWLRDTYLNARKIVLSDGEMKSPAIDDTILFRKVHMTALEFIWKGMADNAPKKYPTLKKEIDAAVEGAVPLDIAPFDDEKRESAGEVFDAIAWVANGGK
jgi:hypothetical protein